MSRNKLTLDKVGEISLVDTGDNPRAHVTLLKRKAEPASAAAPTPTPTGAPTMLGKMREAVITTIAKATNKSPDEVRKWWGDATEAKTFDQVLNSVSWEDICEEVRECNYALMESFCGTLRDSSLTAEQKVSVLTTSLNQFSARLLWAIPVWTGGSTAMPEPEPADAIVGKSGRKISGERLALLTSAHEQLGQILADVNPAAEADTPTPDDGTMAETTTEKTKPEAAPDPSADDVLKGVTDPAVRAALASLQKRASDAEARATETAAQLEKREEETATAVLKARFAKGGDLELVGADDAEIADLRKLQKSDPEAFKTVEKRLLAAHARIDKTALLGEIGSSGTGAGGDGMTALTAKAAELRQADPTLSQPQAIAKAVQLHPELAGAARDSIRGVS